MEKKQITANTGEAAGNAAVPVVEPKKESKNAKQAAEIFERNPNAKKLYFTDDGLAFFEKNDAENHAASLNNKKIETINN
ncbi:MAG: hypothetical protein LBC68_07120 [Prevotellaceae bacterium]|jgi:hypothetical protein|nr:hypothetical protein [Prevotellaceae bacterium]